MTVCNFSKEDALIFHETIEPYLAVLGHNEEVSVVIGKLERLHNVVHLDLMLNEERLSVVEDNIVTILAHYCEPLS
jgi:hypothetical protein